MKRPRLLNAQCLMVHQIWLKLETDLNTYHTYTFTEQRGLLSAHALVGISV